MLSHEEFVAIKDRAADLFLPLPGVELVGVGGRERDGLDVDERVIKVFVRRKKAPEELPAEHLIPATFEGVGVDVVGMDAPGPTLPLVTLAGVSKPSVNSAEERQVRSRVVLQGKSTLVAGTAVNSERGNDGGYGTLGCFLVDRVEPEKKVYALSNFHVLGFSQPEEAVKGKAKVGQPGPDRTCCSNNNIGVYVEGGFGGPSEPKPSDATFTGTVDAAVAQLDPGVNWRPWVYEGQWPIRGKSTVPIQNGQMVPIGVKKRGVRTGMTGGIVDRKSTRLNSSHRP